MRRVGSVIVLCLGLTGCPSPTQYGGPIPVDHQGLAERMGLLCRAGRTPQGHCVPDPERHAELTASVDAGDGD
jgi:hypothetical protein